MKSELKKLKGVTIKTILGQISFKQYTRLQTSEFDQIYFKTNYQDSICKIYDLTDSVSVDRYHNQTDQYHAVTVPCIHGQTHCEQFKIKKKSYGLVIFIGLAKNKPIYHQIESIQEAQILSLAQKLLILLKYLKQEDKVFFNIRPHNIYKAPSNFSLIDAEFLSSKHLNQQTKQFIYGMVEKDWQFWAPEMLDPYSVAQIDYNIDIFAIGCLLYKLKFKQYPFQTKLAQMNISYSPLPKNSKDIINQIISSCLVPLEIRKNLQINKYLEQLKLLISTENSPIRESIKSSLLIRKGSGSAGILDNISSAFSKMINDTEGFYLNYVEDNQKQPLEKHLEGILIKIYKGDDKIQKLSAIIDKYMLNNPTRIYSKIKTLLLIGNLLRKGPLNLNRILKDHIKLAMNNSQNLKQIEVLGQLLLKKVNLIKKIKKCMAGNFFISDLSKFKHLEIIHFRQLINYLETLVKSLAKYTSQIVSTELTTAVIYFFCDDIYDLVSMIVMSIIALRKDNDLQFRSDNLGDLPAEQKRLNTCLKKISALSNFTGAHAIYSIQNDYIVYQQEINLASNPYYSSLEHFYKSSRGYKGLTLPCDYQAHYTGVQHSQKINNISSHHNKNIQSHQKKYFANNQEGESDDEGESKTKKLKSFNFSQFSQISKCDSPIPNICKAKSSGNKQKNQEDKSSKNSKDSLNDKKNSVKNKQRPNIQVSFDSFVNVIIKQPQTPITPKQSIKNQFNFFEKLNEQSLARPPIPHKKKTAQKQSKEPHNSGGTKNNDIKLSFDQFSKIKDKHPSSIIDKSGQKRCEKKQNKKQVVNLQLEFEHLSQMQHPPKFENNPFAKQFAQNSSNLSLKNKKRDNQKTNGLNNGSYNVGGKKTIKSTKNLEISNPSNDYFNQFTLSSNQMGSIQPPKQINPFLQSILKGLKLKQLKQLLKKNQNLLIDYHLLTFMKVIGSGSAGEVSYGTYKEMPVAIKKVKYKQNPNALKQFERQLVTYIKIKKNCHLVSLIGLSENNGDFFLITQFCEYGSLFDILHKRLDLQFTWAEKLSFCLQIAEGMLFLHSMKPVIIHRDLKSLNIFVSKENQKCKMKVADFGLSRSPQAQMMTTQLGTIHWMAPQLLEGKQYSLKVDIYSYGVLMWEILSRKTPFNHLQNPMAILKYVVIDKMRPDLSQIPNDCPKELIDIVKKCWSHQPSSRPCFSTIIRYLKMINL